VPLLESIIKIGIKFGLTGLRVLHPLVPKLKAEGIGVKTNNVA
jgi:hypothetical protein